MPRTCFIHKRQSRELTPKKKWLPYAIFLPLVFVLVAVGTVRFCLNRELVAPDNILSDDQMALFDDIDTLNPHPGGPDRDRQRDLP